MREDFTRQTKSRLALRVGLRCSNPDCRVSTAGPASDGGATSVGVACHIVAASNHGPRANNEYTKEQRTDVANGIWLCANCARMIDRDPTRFTTSVLRAWRSLAEQRADEELGQATRQTDALRFASIQILYESYWEREYRLEKRLAGLGGEVLCGFHEIPERFHDNFPDKTQLDPVMDITLVNESMRHMIVSDVGLIPDALWNTLKGLSPAYKVVPIDTYDLDLEKFVVHEPQFLSLPDPIAIPPGTPCRFKLRLKGFNRAMVRNNAIVRFLVIANSAIVSSGPVYMGIN